MYDWRVTVELQRRRFLCHMLDKAKAHLEAAELLYEQNHYRDAVSRAYYAAFSAMQAFVGAPPRGRWVKPYRGIRHVKPKLYEALKTFEERIETTFPGASFSLTDPFGGNDIGVELTLPVTRITREDRMKISELAAEIEEEFDVYVGTVVKALA